MQGHSETVFSLHSLCILMSEGHVEKRLEVSSQKVRIFYFFFFSKGVKVNTCHMKKKKSLLDFYNEISVIIEGYVNKIVSKGS